MPSAARQRLHVDLCRQGDWKHINGSPGPVSHIQEIQASPGHCDISQEDKQQKRQGSKKHFYKSPRKQAVVTGRGSPKSIPRRGSVDTLNKGLSDSEGNSGSDRRVTFELSSSAKSYSCPSLNPLTKDAYAMDSSVAPHPCQVPFPPLEWLQSSSKQSTSPVVSDVTLKTILRCQVAA